MANLLLLAAQADEMNLKDNPYVALFAGCGISLFAVCLLLTHMMSWRRQRNDPALTDEDRVWLAKRFRRRMQTSGMLVIIGVLIPVGDQLLPLDPRWFAIYWLVVLAATV